MRHPLLVLALLLSLALPPAALAKAQPTFAPVVAEPSLKLTNCAVICPLRDVLAGSDQNLVVALRPTPPAPTLTADDAQLVLQGDHHHAVRVLDGHFDADPDRVTMATGGALPADHWTGSLLIDPSSGADEVAIPIAIDVREGPDGPLAALVLSVLLGYLISRVFGALPKARFRRKARQLRGAILLKPAVERAVLLPAWERAWELRGDDVAKAQERLDGLVAGANALTTARDVQDEALRSKDALSLVAWVQRVGTALAHVVDAVREGNGADEFPALVGSVESAAAQLRAAEEARRTHDDLVARARAGSPAREPYQAFKAAAAAVDAALTGVSTDPGDDPPDLQPLLAAQQNAFDALEAAHSKKLELTATPTPKAASVGAAAQTVVTAMGWPAPGEDATAVAGARFDVAAALAGALAPLASLVLAIVLLAVGFKVTYLDNASFGATLGDWLALVFWGMAAWGTRQTLTGLGPPAGG